MKVFAVAFLGSVFLASNSFAACQKTMIEDFSAMTSGAAPTGGWVQGTPPTGSSLQQFVVDQGYNGQGKGLKMTYTLNNCSTQPCGQQHVRAVLKVDELPAGRWTFPLCDPDQDPVLRVRVYSPPNVSITLKLRDAEGKLFKYTPYRSLEWAAHVSAHGSSNWYKLIARLRLFEADGHSESMGEIEQIILEVGDPLRKGPTTDIVRLDDLYLHPDSNAQFIHDSDEPFVSVAPRAGSLGRRLGITHSIEVEPPQEELLTKAYEAGIRFVRTDLDWERVEKERGRYVWDGSNGGGVNYDQYAALVREKEMDLLWVLGFGNKTLYDLIGTPRHAEGFKAYAAAAAAHFPAAFNRFEIWNEPDRVGAAFYQPDGADEFAAFAKKAADGVLSAPGEHQVFTGGISNYNFDYFSTVLNTEPGTQASGFGLHAYRGKTRPETVASDTVKANWLVQELHPEKKIWMTEWGHGTSEIDCSGCAVNDAEFKRLQAALNLRAVLSLWAVDAEMIGLYRLTNHMGHLYGMLGGETGAERDFFRVMKVLHTKTVNKTFKGLLGDVPPGLHVMKFQFPAGTKHMYIVWNGHPNSAITYVLPHSGNAVADNMLGNEREPNSGGNTQHIYRLDESDGPLYVYPTGR